MSNEFESKWEQRFEGFIWRNRVKPRKTLAKIVGLRVEISTGELQSMKHDYKPLDPRLSVYLMSLFNLRTNEYEKARWDQARISFNAELGHHVHFCSIVIFISFGTFCIIIISESE
jgi:hypothetical protein